MSDKYQIFEPGKYFDWEKPLIEERFAAVGKVSEIEDVPPVKPVSEYEILDFSTKWDPWNPIYNDQEYARKAGYQDVPALPIFQTPFGAIYMLAIPMDIADTWYYAHGPNFLEFGVPVYPGDSFTSKTEKLTFEDTTVPGSDLRKFLTGCITSLYNQKGEMTVRHILYRREAYRKIIDGSPKPTATEVLSEWVKDLLPAHYTTDGEWEYIRELWDKEYIRGKDTLYWEDVNVGDEPTWTCSGPISHMELIRLQGGRGRGFTVRDEGNGVGGGWNARGVMFKDQYGQYLDLTSNHYGGRNIPGARAVFYNDTAAHFIVRMLTNWVGDAGYVTKFGWMFEQFFDHMKYEREGGEYLDKVPYMKGKGCTVHPSEGDTVIAKGYVTEKYVNDKGEHIVDLVCWGETLDRQIIEVCPASVRLPSKGG